MKYSEQIFNVKYKIAVPNKNIAIPSLFEQHYCEKWTISSQYFPCRAHTAHTPSVKKIHAHA